MYKYFWGNSKTLTTGPRTPHYGPGPWTTYGPVHGLPLRTPLRITRQKIKNKNRDLTWCLSNRFLVSAKFRALRLLTLSLRAGSHSLMSRNAGNEIQCSLWISITKCHFHITSYLTELFVFWWHFRKEDTLWCFWGIWGTRASGKECNRKRSGGAESGEEAQGRLKAPPPQSNHREPPQSV